MEMLVDVIIVLLLKIPYTNIILALLLKMLYMDVILVLQFKMPYSGNKNDKYHSYFINENISRYYLCITIESY